jgi:hypothetical protein
MRRVPATTLALAAALLAACHSLPASLPTDPPGNVQPTYEGMANECAVPRNGACEGCSVKCWNKLQVAVCRPSVETPPWTVADPAKRVPCFQAASCECR